MPVKAPRRYTVQAEDHQRHRRADSAPVVKRSDEASAGAGPGAFPSPSTLGRGLSLTRTASVKAGNALEWAKKHGRGKSLMTTPSRPEPREEAEVDESGARRAMDEERVAEASALLAVEEQEEEDVDDKRTKRKWPWESFLKRWDPKGSRK